MRVHNLQTQKSVLSYHVCWLGQETRGVGLLSTVSVKQHVRNLWSKANEKVEERLCSTAIGKSSKEEERPKLKSQAQALLVFHSTTI